MECQVFGHSDNSCQAVKQIPSTTSLLVGNEVTTNRLSSAEGEWQQVEHWRRSSTSQMKDSADASLSAVGASGSIQASTLLGVSLQGTSGSASKDKSSADISSTSMAAPDTSQAPSPLQSRPAGDGVDNSSQTQGEGNANSVITKDPSAISTASLGASVEPLLANGKSPAAKETCSDPSSGSDSPSPVPLINSRLAARLKDIDGPVNLQTVGNHGVGDPGKASKPLTSNSQPMLLARRPGPGKGGGHPVST